MRRGIKLLLYVVCMVLLCTLGAVVFTDGIALAQSGDQPGQNESGLSPSQSNEQPIVANEVCLGCHGNPGMSMNLENGDILDLYVNTESYAASIHGKDGYACVQCHTNLGEYPHPAFNATDIRDVTLQLTKVCDRCHSGEYTRTMDSVHAAAQAAGKREAAVCVDCHGSHQVKQLTDPQTKELLPQARLDIPVTCSRCHFAIYQKYLGSVHGAALTQEGNTDVPTCIDCHGVHNIGNPTTAAFRLKSPELCASCHTNPQLMDKYGIPTNVLNTYVSDFHGTTVQLFEKQSPDAPTNKPVCYDCHGVHDISKVDDPQSGIAMKQNLLVRCKVCHPDATDNFPSAWMSHYIPSPSHFPEVYYVNLFYKIFIPLVLGSMIALVGMDVGHSFYSKARRGKQSTHEEPPEQPPAPPVETPLEATRSEASTTETQEQGDAATTSPETPAQPDREDEEEQNG